ncbi:MAG: tRNA threonylcarbamoyladenosine dehydratase [Clostridiales bacterium]|nr:tRNA threonylcarbamoyladenosine dehydratase [Clostridiales bacterium]
MQFARTALLLGEQGVEKLKNSRVAVFGLGGVGGYAVEALARSGVGAIDLIDNDTVSLSNINRQIIALHSTVGRKKTEVLAERVKDINPDICVKTYDLFVLYETVDEIDFSAYDYVVDAIDTVSGKLAIIERAKESNIPVISSMGTGNKLNPMVFEVADIEKTSVCPLARVMRRELKKRGIAGVKVVYSKEETLPPSAVDEDTGKAIPASVAFVPSVAGLLIAAEVIKDLVK